MPKTNICDECLFNRNGDCAHPEGPNYTPEYKQCNHRYNILYETYLNLEAVSQEGEQAEW